MPVAFDDVGECVESALRRVGRKVVLAVPLGLGKPVPVLDEFLRRALRDPGLDLTIITALTLRRPAAGSELERRFMEPLAARLFGDYHEPEYVAAQRLVARTVAGRGGERIDTDLARGVSGRGVELHGAAGDVESPFDVVPGRGDGEVDRGGGGIQVEEALFGTCCGDRGEQGGDGGHDRGGLEVHFFLRRAAPSTAGTA